MSRVIRAGAVVMASLVSAAVPAIAQQIQPVIPVPPPVARMHQTFVVPSEVQGLLGNVEIRTLEKQLVIKWSYDVGGQRVFYDEPFDLSYWPTAAARISDARLTSGRDLLVAGKRPGNGKTVIERWELALVAAPSAGNPTEVSKEVIRDSSVFGKREVRLMEPVNGLPGKALVQFHDSDDLYSIDAMSGSLSLIATPAQVPKLASEDLVTVTPGRMVSGSYVYIYQSDFSYHDGGALLMYDNDADGLVDSWTPIPDVYAWEDFMKSPLLQERFLD